MGREGFEPSKAEPTDLQSAPFDRSGTSPCQTTRSPYPKRSNMSSLVKNKLWETCPWYVIGCGGMHVFNRKRTPFRQVCVQFPAAYQIRTDDPEITSHVLWPAELRRRFRARIRKIATECQVKIPILSIRLEFHRRYEHLPWCGTAMHCIWRLRI